VRVSVNDQMLRYGSFMMRGVAGGLKPGIGTLTERVKRIS